MKRLFTHNWQIKIISIILAFTIWYLIKKNISGATFQQLPPPRALATP